MEIPLCFAMLLGLLIGIPLLLGAVLLIRKFPHVLKALPAVGVAILLVGTISVFDVVPCSKSSTTAFANVSHVTTGIMGCACSDK